MRGFLLVMRRGLLVLEGVGARRVVRVLCLAVGYPRSEWGERVGDHEERVEEVRRGSGEGLGPRSGRKEFCSDDHLQYVL